MFNKTKQTMLPLLFPGHNRPDFNTLTVFAGDVGATKTNLALFKMNGGQGKVIKERNYRSQQYKSIAELTDEFLKDQPKPDACCIGVAGPVFNGNAKLTNLDWELNSQEIARHLGLSNAFLINDLEATGYGLAMLTDEETVIIHKGSDEPSGNVAILAPGTGLGEAGIYFDGMVYHPFATEGGHSDFASRDKFDFEIYEYLQKKFGHVSNERLICGPGIVNIYQFLKEEKKLEEPAWITDEIEQGDSPAVISRRIDQSARCNETMRLFIRYLAHESANLALKMKATGGLFIGGGIAPQIIPLFEKYRFNASFISSGRMNHLLEKVPVRIILNTKTAMLGAAYYGATG